MPWKGLDIRHHNGFSLQGCRATDTFPQLNTDAGRLTLEGTHNEDTLLEKIESCPVEVGQGVVDQRRRIRCVGHEVALAAEQPTELLGEARVVACLVAKIVAFSCKAHEVPGEALRAGAPPDDLIFTEQVPRAPLSFVRLPGRQKAKPGY